MIGKWYFADEEQRVGPFSLADLKANLQNIPNWKDLLVWRDGFSEWQRAGSVNEILALFATPPPVPKNSASELPLGLAPLDFSAAEKSSWSVAKILGGIALLAAAVIAGAFGKDIGKGAYEFVTQPSMAKNAVDIEEGFAKALVRMRAELPKKIDEITTLMWVHYEGTKMIYENRLAIDGAKLDDAMKGKLRQLVTQNVCATAETRRVLDLGGSFRYVYADIAAKPVMTLDIVKHNCA